MHTGALSQPFVFLYDLHLPWKNYIIDGEVMTCCNHLICELGKIEAVCVRCVSADKELQQTKAIMDVLVIWAGML